MIENTLKPRFLIYVVFCQLVASCATPLTVDRALEKCFKISTTSERKRWYMPNDLPTDWIYRQKEKFYGNGRFIVEVNRYGRVANCQVAVSSGFSPIDKSICANLTRRALFNSVDDRCADNFRSVEYIVKLKWDVNSNRDPSVSIIQVKK
jgi:hypothetical protein